MRTESAPPTNIEHAQSQSFIDQVCEFTANARIKLGRVAAAGLLTLTGATCAYTAGEAADPAPAAAYEASTGDYPWHDATELNAANSDYGYETCPDSAPNCKTKTVTRNNVVYGVYDPWNYYFRNCTSYAAWSLANEFGVDPSGLGNAKTWDDRAPDKGWVVDQTPEVGDVAQWNSGTWGHVAIVSEIGTGPNSGKVRVSEYNQGLDGNFRDNRWVVADNYIDVRGENATEEGEEPPSLQYHELGFVRTNHASGRTELSLWDGAPHYSTHHNTTLTGYPAISDPEHVTPLAIDTNGDGIDELGFVRTNHSSGRTELSLWHGSPHYTTGLTTTLTGYPAISDPENVVPIAIDATGDGKDELGFIRFNHYSGRTELSLWHGEPYYTTPLGTYRTPYPAISDPENVVPVAIDLSGDETDELGFIRLNHAAGRAEIVAYRGAPAFHELVTHSLTPYPAVSDPENVTPLAIDVTGDGIDELAFVRTNHSSGRTEIVTLNGAPTYHGFHSPPALTGYPAISDPANVTPLAIHLP